ncbi:MAG: site-2 protease family protein [Archangium sp.]
MNPRVRRVFLLATMSLVLWRMLTLGQERGWELVLRSTALVTGLAVASWLVHVVFHELAHLVAARSQRFELRGLRFGPLGFDFTGPKVKVRLGFDLGGGVNSLPIGVTDVKTRLRRVALAGPTVTAIVTLVTFIVWRSQDTLIASPLGIFLVTGVFALVTALTPSVLLPSAPASGTDLEQIIGPRRVIAHWTNAAALQAISKGARISEVLDWRSTSDLLPDGGEVEGFELGWSIACLDAGEVQRGQSRLKDMVSRLDDDAPEWLRTDTFNQLGVLSAFDGDLVYAQACLEQVKQTQSMDWYCELLVACIEQQRGGDWQAALARWQHGVDGHPGKVFALAGNEWVLKRLNSR